MLTFQLTNDYKLSISDFHINSISRQPNCITNKYRAPETFSNDDYSYYKADVYSYGLVLHTLLSGKIVPCRMNRNENAILNIGNEEEITKNPILSLLFDVMKNCLQQNPTDRLTFQEIAKQLSKYFYEQANSFKKEKKLDEALDYFSEYLAVESNDSQAYLSRAEVHLEKKDHDAAINDYQIAVDIDLEYTNEYLRISKLIAGDIDSDDINKTTEHSSIETDDKEAPKYEESIKVAIIPEKEKMKAEMEEKEQRDLDEFVIVEKPVEEDLVQEKEEEKEKGKEEKEEEKGEIHNDESQNADVQQQLDDTSTDQKIDETKEETEKEKPVEDDLVHEKEEEDEKNEEKGVHENPNSEMQQPIDDVNTEQKLDETKEETEKHVEEEREETNHEKTQKAETQPLNDTSSEQKLGETSVDE